MKTIDGKGGQNVTNWGSGIKYRLKSLNLPSTPGLLVILRHFLMAHPTKFKYKLSIQDASRLKFLEVMADGKWFFMQF